MLKFISIKFIVSEFSKVFYRFAITLLCSLVASITVNAIFWEESNVNSIWYSKIIITCYIGLCFSLAIYLYFESKPQNKTNALLKQILVLLVPFLFFISIYTSTNIWTENVVQRNFVLLLAGHLL
jgi:hypothetical protein